MINTLWSVMILAGMLWGAACGNLDGVTQGLIDSAQEAVTLGITMLGIMSFWCGILEVGNRAGLIDWLTGRMEPVISFLFPELEKGHPARRPIAVNIIANVLGLGMAATPAGLEAMKLMKEDEGDDENSDAGKQGSIGETENSGKIRCSGITATNSMCTFLIINISSLQLIPINMVAYRSQYGSSDPTAVLGPALIATACSTAVAVLFCKLMDICGRLR